MEHLEHRELLSVSGSVSGSVYYDLNQNGDRDAAEVGVPDWTVEIQKIGDQELGELLDTIESPSLQQSRRFATSVAVYEDASNVTHLFVASPNSEPAMILWYDASGDLKDTIIDPVPGGSFGSSLAVVGNTLLVGDANETVADPGDPGVEYLQAGAVYAFNLTDGSLGETYYRPDSSDLDEDAPAAGDLFGFSLAGLTGGFVVGAPGDDLSETDGGAAYRFSLATDNCETIYEASGLPGAALGTSIATDGTQVLIGAPDAEVSDEIVGKAFLFNLAGGTAVHEWTGPNLSDFGRSVALLGDNAYVGAPLEQIDAAPNDVPAGKVHVYNRISGAEQADIRRPARVAGDPGDFGRAMAVEGTNLFVSDPYNDAVFRFAGGTQTPNVEYTNPRTESTEFGYALTAHDGHPLVGDPSATYNTRAPGAAYRYEAPGSTATVLKSLSTTYNPTPVLSEDPSPSYAILSSGIVVVGDGADDTGGERSGCVTIIETGNPPITISEPPTGLGPQAEAMFGYCVVEVDGGYFLASAPGLNVDGVESVGEAYLFDTGGNLIQTFKNPFPGAGDRFGGAIRVSGNYALINCWPDADISDVGDDPNNSGAVCMFEINTDPTGPDEAVYVGSFMTFKNHFGNSVAALGDNLLVGVPDSDSGGVIDTGAVYLMSPDTAWPMLTLTAASTGTPAGDGDQFGFQVAAAGDNILVSAPGRAVDGTNAAGAVYLFDSDGDLLQVFENPSPEEGDGFGMSVAVVDDCVLIGAPYHDEAGAIDTGAAYLFPIDPTGSNRYPSPVATFLNPDDTDGDPATDGTEDWFGWSVCGEGDDIVIGAPGDDDAFSQENVGAAYRFQWNASTRVWDDSSLNYPGFASPEDYFGWSVSMTDDRFLISARGEDVGQTAHAGKAFLFDREDPTIVQTLQPPSPQQSMGFGWSSVSVRDNRVLVTAATLQQSQQPGDLNGDGMVGSDDLDRIREYWGQYVTPGDLLAGDASGDGFVGSDDLDIIRANWGDSLPPAIAGSAYLFDAEDGRLLRTFAEPTSAQYGFFGMSAAVVGDEVLVSAPNASLVISEEGAVYRFDMGITLVDTDSSGDYSFTGLEEGTYRVRQRPATGYWQTEPDGPTTYTVDVTTSEYDFPGRDFGVALIDYDADDDGLLDAWEISYGFDPSESDENSNGLADYQDDADGDGVTNIEEFDYGTNPNAMDTDGDGTNDDVEISQGSDPNDAGDGGLAPPGDMIIGFVLEMGDLSNSRSERWSMEMGDVHCTQSDYGTMEQRYHFFDKGESYEITLDHLGTDPSFLQYLQDRPAYPPIYYPQGAVGPNYDWNAYAGPTFQYYDVACWLENPLHTVDDAYGQSEYRLVSSSGFARPVIGKPNLAEGKTATYHLPLLDADVDSKNDSGFNVPDDNEEEDRLELDSTTGKYVIVNDEDVDGDGIIDYHDMRIDDEQAKFVPMKLTLSKNVEVAGLGNPNDIMYRFVYPHEPADPSDPDAPVEPKYIRLWMPGKDASVQRTENDIIRPGVPIPRSDLHLDPGGSVVVYIEGLAASPGPISIQVYANVNGTEVQWTEELTVPLYDKVHVEVIDVDIDTDSNNNGYLDAGDDAVEDVGETGVGQVGKRIFINEDDDNRNGEKDVDDDSSDYGLIYEDNDFAEVTFAINARLSQFNGYQLWLGASSGLDLYSSKKKERINMPAADVPSYATEDWYCWTITDGEIGDLPTDAAGCPTVFAEGVELGEEHVYWRLVKPGGNGYTEADIVLRDTVEINVEKIVWPSNEPLADMSDPDNWANQDSENWDGFELGEAWEINRSLCEIINGADSDIRTRYPEKQSSGAWQGTDDYKTTKMDRPSGDYTVTVMYAFQEAPLGRTIHSFADTTHDYIKPGFHMNSGIFIGQTEIQIFNSTALASLLNAEDTGGTVVLDGNPSARIYAYDDESTKKVWLAKTVGGQPSHPDHFESYSGLVNAIVYNKTGSTDAEYIAYDSNDVEVPLNTLNAVENARMGGQIDIAVRPNAPVYKLEVTCSGVTYRYKALPATSTSADANKITLQSHWGSGVVFTNVSITED